VCAVAGSLALDVRRGGGVGAGDAGCPVPALVVRFGVSLWDGRHDQSTEEEMEEWTGRIGSSSSSSSSSTTLLQSSALGEMDVMRPTRSFVEKRVSPSAVEGR
jgi:hypothetical protein